MVEDDTLPDPNPFTDDATGGVGNDDNDGDNDEVEDDDMDDAG